MKKCINLIFLLLFVQTTFAQQLFFSKDNYANQGLFKKNIPTLARQVIARYHPEDSTAFDDNLYKLQVAAEDYKTVPHTINVEVFKQLGDSMHMPGIELPIKIFSQVMLSNPGSKQAFDSAFLKIYPATFEALDEENKNTANGFMYETPLPELKATLKEKSAALQGKDSLSLKQATELCTAYASYIVYTATRPLSLKMEGDKYLVQDSVLLKMPDGGTIAVTVVRDKKYNTPQPVVLMFSIYPGAEVDGCKMMVRKGYTGIIANIRGKRLGTDTIVPFEFDPKDAYNIIDWISKQPWCNGKVGMYGGSYLGYSQWAATKYLHPALKTIVPQVAAAPGIDLVLHNGVTTTYTLRWLHFVIDNKLTDGAGFSNVGHWNTVFNDWYKKGASFRSLDTLEGRPNAIFQRWLQHPSYDSYWKKMTPQESEFTKINIPILNITGYFDGEQLGALYYYEQYNKWNAFPNAYLVIGPYDHFGSQANPKPVFGGYQLDSVANISIADLVFKWFDYALKDSTRPAILKDKVNFEIMGKNEWKHVASLEKMHNDSLVFYLGNMLTDKHYTLLPQKPATTAFTTQEINLADRSDAKLKVDSIAEEPKMILDTLALDKEDLTFFSAPLEQPLTISGSIKASIVASMNKKDADLDIIIFEQTPDGKFLFLNQSLQRISYAWSRSQRRLLQPGKITTIPLEHNDYISNQFQKGSRIVIVFSVPKSKNLQINYGTGKDVNDETIKDAGAPLKIKWYNTSTVTLPVLR